MFRTAITVFVLLFANSIVKASSNPDSLFTETAVTLHTATGDIFGTLTLPKNFTKGKVALIIAGSGPTDRNGNNPFMKNESLKMLAYGLAEKNIASVRYDKRGIAASAGAAKSEADLRFEDYINDAKEWVNLLKKDSRFAKVIIVGHSEGSLIGMVAAKQSGADGFVSLAGAGRSADQVLKEQLSSQPEKIKDPSFAIIDSLVLGKTVSKVDPVLYSLFRPSVQPYMISWFHYDPQKEIQKLTMPVLIVQGTNDIQVSVNEAQLLKKAYDKGQLVLIENMNHILKIVKGDRNENAASYSDPSLPVSNQLVTSIADFINKN